MEKERLDPAITCDRNYASVPHLHSLDCSGMKWLVILILSAACYYEAEKVSSEFIGKVAGRAVARLSSCGLCSFFARLSPHGRVCTDFTPLHLSVSDTESVAIVSHYRSGAHVWVVWSGPVSILNPYIS